MTLSEDDLRTLWRERTAQVLTDRPLCLTEADWTRLLSKQMDAAERVHAAEHIGSCAQCADEYRLLQPLQGWGEGVKRVLSPGDRGSTSRWDRWRAWWSSPRLSLALSAVTLLLVTQGVTLWRSAQIARENAQLERELADGKTAWSSTQNSLTASQQELERTTAAQGELQQRLAQLSAPQLGVAIAELEPQFGGDLRGATEPQTVTIAENSPSVTLILNFAPLASRSTLEVEVVDQGGRVRWTGRTQRETAASTLTLTLPSVDYPSGDYLIRLFDVTAARTALAAYPVIIRHALQRSR
jgi:hypothetical protein